MQSPGSNCIFKRFVQVLICTIETLIFFLLNVHFNNYKHSTLDERMDQHDVYKVESISDSYLVASGLPKKNGDK